MTYVVNPADGSLPSGIGQAVSSSGGAWVAGAIRRLTDHRDLDFSPTWSPDGRHIAFSSDRDGNADIYVMGSDGSNPRRLTNHSAADGVPSWSPDGRHIAFSSDRDGNADIYVMGSDGSNPRRLTNHSAADGVPSWSPDGRHIAFSSDRDGNADIYVMGSDISVAVAIGGKGDVTAIRRPRRNPVGSRVVRQAAGVAPIRTHHVNGSNPRRLTLLVRS